MTDTEKFTSVKHEWKIAHSSEDAFMITSREVDAYCARLRNVLDPLTNADNWATATISLCVGAIFSLAALPDKGDHPTLTAIYAVSIVAFGFLSAFFVLLSRKLGRGRTSHNDQLADELEALRDARLPKTNGG